MGEQELPVPFYISSSFTEEERLSIQEQADEWNKISLEHTGKKAFLYQGLNDKPFDMYTDLTDKVHTVYLHTGASDTPAVGWVDGWQNDIIIEQEVFTSWRVADKTTAFKAVVRHELGHLLGILWTHVNEGTYAGPPSVIDIGTDGTFLTFSKEDIRLFCLAHKCLEEVKPNF